MRSVISSCVVLTKKFGFAAILIGTQLPASAQEVLGIFLEERGTWGFSTVSYVPHLLFKNGEVFANINMPLEDLDIASSRKTEPERWGRWQKEGKNIVFVMPDGKRDKLLSSPVVPASNDLRIEGVWAHQSVGGTGDFIVAVESDVGFSPDGIFAEGRFSGAGGRDLTDTSSVVGYSKVGLAPKGTYRLSGYTAEFTYKDGRTERRLFFFYPRNDGAPDYKLINLGTTSFLRKATKVNFGKTSQAPAASPSAAATNARKSTATTATFSKDFISTFRSIIRQATTVVKFKKACDDSYPETTATNTRLLRSWERTNALKGVGALAANLAGRSPKFQRELAGAVSALEKRTREVIDKHPGLCTNFARFLRKKSTAIRQNHSDWFSMAESKLPQYFDK